MGRYSELVNQANLKFFPPGFEPTAQKSINDFYKAYPQIPYPSDSPQSIRENYMRLRQQELNQFITDTFQPLILNSPQVQKVLTTYKNDPYNYGDIGTDIASAVVFGTFLNVRRGDNGLQDLKNIFSATAKTYFYYNILENDKLMLAEQAQRADRGESFDSFLGMRRDLFIKDLTAVQNVVTIAGIGVAVGAIAIAASGAGAAGAAAGGATESGTLLGSAGLLGESGSTVAALEGAGLSLPALSLGGTELASGGVLATIAAAANSEEGKKLLDQGTSFLFGNKKQPTPASTTTQSPAAQTEGISLVKLLTPLSAILAFL